MRARDFILLEYDSAKTLANFRDRIAARMKKEFIDIYGEHEPIVYEQGLVKTLKDFETADPTSKKAYVLDLLRMYLDGSMQRVEDVFKATEPLRLYSKFRNRGLPPIRSMTFPQLLDLGDELSEVMSQSDESRAEEAKFFEGPNNQAYLAFDNEKFKVVVPFTEEAAKFFGRGTRWCTAAENNNMFSHYYNGEKSSAKRLWIVIFKGQKGKKWQIQLATGQFMDARDEDIDDKTWFEETDFVSWFANSVMRIAMPKYWEKIYRYYPDMDSLSPSLKDKIVSANIRLLAYFKKPTDEMLLAAAKATSEFAVKSYMQSLRGDHENLAVRLQLAAFKAYGLHYGSPKDVLEQNRQAYNDMVRKALSLKTPASAFATGFHLPKVARYALDNDLAGQYTDMVRQGIEKAV